MRGASSPLVPLALDERGEDRAAGEPGTLESLERLAARKQRADAGRPAEHFVEGQCDEVRMPLGEIEQVGRNEGGRVEEHVPAVRVGPFDPLEWVLDAGEVGLGWVGEQVVLVADNLGEVAREQLSVDAELGRLARDVAGLGAAGAREFADPVDRVVVVEGKEEAVAGTERVGLANEVQRAGRVRSEDRHVLVRRGAEELEYVGTCPLDQLGHRCRGRVERVRVAEDFLPE
jgi:hypothetical protein